MNFLYLESIIFTLNSFDISWQCQCFYIAFKFNACVAFLCFIFMQCVFIFSTTPDCSLWTWIRIRKTQWDVEKFGALHFGGIQWLACCTISAFAELLCEVVVILLNFNIWCIVAKLWCIQLHAKPWNRSEIKKTSRLLPAEKQRRCFLVLRLKARKQILWREKGSSLLPIIMHLLRSQKCRKRHQSQKWFHCRKDRRSWMPFFACNLAECCVQLFIHVGYDMKFFAWSQWQLFLTDYIV